MARQNGKWLWVDPTTGKNRFPYTFDSIDQFYREGKASVVLDGRKKFLLLNGELEDRR
jgi:hypothetical protein